MMCHAFWINGKTISSIFLSLTRTFESGWINLVKLLQHIYCHFWPVGSNHIYLYEVEKATFFSAAPLVSHPTNSMVLRLPHGRKSSVIHSKADMPMVLDIEKTLARQASYLTRCFVPQSSASLYDSSWCHQILLIIHLCYQICWWAPGKNLWFLRIPRRKLTQNLGSHWIPWQKRNTGSVTWPDLTTKMLVKSLIP